MTYLVTGATGAIGRLVINQLAASGADVTALSRKPGQANLPAAVKVVQGDLTQSDFPHELFAGVKSVFLFPVFGDLRPFLGRAKAAGVEHVVVLSSLAAAAEFPRDLNSPSYRHHRGIEQAVEASGLPYTFLRPGSFANNLRFWASTIKASRMVYGPYPQSAQALIHEADVADVAAAVLTAADQHRGKIYRLTGPQSLTQVAQLMTIGAAIGQELRFQEISPEQFAQSMSQYMPADIIQMMLDYWCDTVDQPDIVRPDVEQITGKPARPLAQWAADHVADFF